MKPVPKKFHAFPKSRYVRQSPRHLHSVAFGATPDFHPWICRTPLKLGILYAGGHFTDDLSLLKTGEISWTLSVRHQVTLVAACLLVYDWLILLHFYFAGKPDQARARANNEFADAYTIQLDLSPGTRRHTIKPIPRESVCENYEVWASMLSTVFNNKRSIWFVVLCFSCCDHSSTSAQLCSATRFQVHQLPAVEPSVKVAYWH